jgi:FkbM family methyltransferase
MLDQKVIRKILQKENPIILEIGSHIGLDTLKFLNEFTDITIYCFEPDPRCILVFKQIINDQRCILIEAAVSNVDGKGYLHLSGGWPHMYKDPTDWIYGSGNWNASSTIKKPISHSSRYPWLIFDKKVEVTTIKLDTWIKYNNINSIDFVWADVQGAEKELIEGAIETLKIIKYLYTEYGEVSPYPEAMTREETIELLERYKFEIVPEYSDQGKIGNLLFKNKYQS